MFKYESYPSSTNMARLAKLLEVQWKDVRDWFVARRNLNKKNGIFPRNQPLTTCLFCPDYEAPTTERAMIHLLSKEHIENMLAILQEHNVMFSKYQNEAHDTKKTEDSEALTVPENAPSKMESEEGKDVGTDVEADRKYQFNPKIVDAMVTSVWKSTKHSGARGETGVEVNRKYQYNPKIVGATATSVQKNTRHSDASVQKNTRHPDASVQKNTRHSDASGQDRTKLNRKTSISPSQSRTVEANSSLARLKTMDYKNLFVGYRCPDCSKVFHSEWMLVRHSITHRKLICSECGEVFSREDLLHDHIKEHLIEAMDRDLYSMYMCFRCFSLNCMCLHKTRYLPAPALKHFLRPQTAKRSRPFLSSPYSGINEHLKVTLKQVLNELSRSFKINSADPSILKNKSTQSYSNQKKEETGVRSSCAPTYTNITTFNCHLCESFFFTHDELEEHVIFHRIQARSRVERNTNAEFLKPSLPPLFFCAYCKKCYRNKVLLRNHFRQNCKRLPSSFSKLVMVPHRRYIQVEAVNGGPFYKIKGVPDDVEKHNRLSKPPKVNCESCSLELSPDKLKGHVRVCRGNPSSNSIPPKEKLLPTEKHPKVLPSVKENDDTNNYYFLCSYCQIPFESKDFLFHHVQETCIHAQKEVNSKSLSLVASGKAKSSHFKRVDKETISSILSPRKLKNILDISTFLPLKSDYRRVKCKFCSRFPMKSCLKLHILNHCKNLPEEIRRMIVVNRSKLFPKKLQTNQSSKKLPVVCAKRSNSINNETSPSNERVDSSVGNAEILKVSSKEDQPKMLYDCHLCEEKFEISINFIAHMSRSHCMTISGESSYKWLYPVNIHEELDDQNFNRKKYTKTTTKKCTTPENHMEQDINFETIAETLGDLEEGELSDCKAPFTISNEDDSLSSPISIKNANPQQGVECDEILDDLENLDNFVETVQLEDFNFVSSMS